MITSTGTLSILTRRWRTILLAGVTVSAVAFAGSRILPLVYISEGSLMIDSRPTTIDTGSNQTVLTEVDLLQSKGLIREAVTKNHLDTMDLTPTVRLPGAIKEYLVGLEDYLVTKWRSFNNQRPPDKIDEVTTYVQRHLAVSAKEKSYVISVQFSGGSPTIAATVVNDIMDTYLAAVEAAKAARVAQSDTWIQQQMAVHRKEVDDAERRITAFVQEHSLPEVQGSLTTAIQLSEEQKQLTLAREDLARKQAAFDSIASGGTLQGADETLASKSIQDLKSTVGKMIGELGPMAQIDPRRATILAAINAINGRIASETALIRTSLARDVEIAHARVVALTASAAAQSADAHNDSVAGTTLRQLSSDLEAKRQVWVSFVTAAGAAKIATENTPTAHQLFAATPPERPARSLGVLSLILGFFGGMTGAGGVIVARAELSNKVNSRNDMADVISLPVFGCLPEARTRKNGNILTAPRTAALVTETFRAMWLQVRPPQPNNGTAILVTSSDVGEGKTTIAVALARQFANDGHRVLLVDADMRRPQLAATLGVKPVAGLESVLSGTATMADAVVTVQAGLDCLLANGDTTNPVKMLSSERFVSFLAESRKRYDFIIFDSPPALHVADPRLIATFCERVIFITQAGRLPSALINEAVRRFAEVDRGKMIPILNRVPVKQMEMQDYYRGYAP